MRRRRTYILVSVLAVGLTLAAVGLAFPIWPVVAQDAIAQSTNVGTPPTGGTQAGVAPTTSATPTETRTPTLTPTPTPTFTARQAQLALAQAYLTGGDFGKAAEIFAAIATEDRGNAEALAGLDAALKGQIVATATAMAPLPTPPASQTPAPSRPSLASVFVANWTVFAGVTLAALATVLLVYLSAKGLRWLLSSIRELWFVRVKRSRVGPCLRVGPFVNATGDETFQGPKVVVQALIEQVMSWNEAVQEELISSVTVDSIEEAGIAWLAALWHRIFLPPRAYKVTGVLAGKQPGPYRLSVDRLDLRTDKVDASHSFEGNAETPAQAFRELATVAAFWVRDPVGSAASPGTMDVPVRVSGLSGTARAANVPTPIQLASEALQLMGMVRQQMRWGTADYSAAPQALSKAQALLDRLPQHSSLQRNLQSALDDLRHLVQPGAVRT
jgi:hypothetical protein